jgi:flagellar assembly factor FliW
MMQVETARFGSLDIEDGKIIRMPQGMLGFAGTRYILLTPPNLGPFCWFQSVDDPNLAFVVTDAKSWKPEMSFTLTAEECRSLELGEPSEVIFLLVVTMAAEPSKITVNLRGPIALNPERQLARQIVFEGEAYPTRHPYFGGVDEAGEARSRSKKAAKPAPPRVA